MSEKVLFSDSNRDIIEILFAIKLNTHTVNITHDELRTLFKSLKKAHRDYFKGCEMMRNPDLGGGVILNPNKERIIIISPGNVEYKESSKFYKDNFNRICKQLYEFYSKVKEVDPDDIKVIGKVYSFNYKLPMSGIDLYQNRIGMYEGQSIKQFELRNTLVDDIFNIHIYITGVASEEAANVLSVKLDVNNFNQDDGVEEDTFDRMINYCDAFAKDKIDDLLNANFP